MVDIQFEEDQESRHSASSEQKSLLIRFILSTGIVSDDTRAEYVLLGVAIFFFIITGIILMTGSKATGLSNADIQRITQLQQSSKPL